MKLRRTSYFERFECRRMLAANLLLLEPSDDLDLVAVQVSASAGIDYVANAFSQDGAAKVVLGKDVSDFDSEVEDLPPSAGFDEAFALMASDEFNYLLTEEFSFETFDLRYSVRSTSASDSFLVNDQVLEIFDVSDSGEYLGLLEGENDLSYVLGDIDSEIVLEGDVLSVNGLSGADDSLFVAGDVSVDGQQRAAVWDAQGQLIVIPGDQDLASAHFVIGDLAVITVGNEQEVFTWDLNTEELQAVLSVDGESMFFEPLAFDDGGAIVGIGEAGAVRAELLRPRSGEVLSNYVNRVYDVDLGRIDRVSSFDRSGGLEAYSLVSENFVGVLSGAAFQNAVTSQDVNASGDVSALDALIVINYLNREGVGLITVGADGNGPFYDVNGDGNATALDALLVINFLNAELSNRAEFEPVYAASFTPAASNRFDESDEEDAFEVLLF